MSNTKITSAVIKDANILTAAIADAAVTSAKIADDVALAGNPTAGTQTAGNNSTRLATTAYTDAAVTALVDSSPSTLNTLNELAAALGDDPNFATTTATSIGLKAPLASPTFTGTVNVTGAVNSTGEMRITNPSATSQLYLYGASGQKANIILNEYGVRAWHVGAGTFTSGKFSISDGTTERLVIDASGKILIGDSASHTSDLLQIETPASGGGHGIQIRRNDSNTDQGVGHIQFGNNTATDLASISAKTDGATDNGALLFNTSVSGGVNTTRMTIDSSGQLLLGTTTSDSTLSVDIQNTSASSNNTLVRIKNTAGSEDSGLVIDGNNGGQQEYRIGVNTAADTSDLTFSGGTGYRWYTGSTERLRLNAAGDVIIGSSGVVRRDLGSATSPVLSIEGTFPAINLRDDGGGGIFYGVNGDTIYLGGNGSTAIMNMYVNDAPSASFIAAGGITFNGDTSTSNALNDYEEGTHVTTFSGTGTVGLDTANLEYTKVGRMVTVGGQVKVTSQSGVSGGIRFTLPFAGQGLEVGAVRLYGVDFTDTARGPICYTSSANLEFAMSQDTAGSTNIPVTTNGYYMFSITYQTS